MSTPSISPREVPEIYWSPIPYSWPYPSIKRGPLNRRKIGEWGLLSSILGRIDIHLRGRRIEAPREGTAGWLAKNLLLFSKSTEKYSVEEFLRQYSRFLSVIGHKDTLLLEIDYEPVYADSENKDTDDLREALAAAYHYLARHRNANKILISTFSRSRRELRDDIDLSIEAQYYRKHGQGKPSIEIRVLGIPSLLARQHLESPQRYRARIKKLFRELRNNVQKEKFAKKYENMIKVKLRDYERFLRGNFDVERTIRWIHMDWGKIQQEPSARARI